jgi:hypothetical protein
LARLKQPAAHNAAQCEFAGGITTGGHLRGDQRSAWAGRERCGRLLVGASMVALLVQALAFGYMGILFANP